MFVGITTDGGECFQFAPCLQPAAEGPSITPAPAFCRENKLQPVENEKVKNANEQIVRRLQKLDAAVQSGDSARRQHASLLQLVLQPYQHGAQKRFVLKCGEDLGKQVEIVPGFFDRVRCFVQWVAIAGGDRQVHQG